jgi:hypothetical protein
MGAARGIPGASLGHFGGVTCRLATVTGHGHRPDLLTFDVGDGPLDLLKAAAPPS